MVDKDVVMKIMIPNNQGLILKSTRSLGSKEGNVIIVRSTLKDFGVNMLAHQTKPILLKSLIQLMK